jgi:hypothetical protein
MVSHCLNPPPHTFRQVNPNITLDTMIDKTRPQEIFEWVDGAVCVLVIIFSSLF